MKIWTRGMNRPSTPMFAMIVIGASVFGSCQAHRGRTAASDAKMIGGLGAGHEQFPATFGFTTGCTGTKIGDKVALTAALPFLL